MARARRKANVFVHRVSLENRATYLVSDCHIAFFLWCVYNYWTFVTLHA